MQNLPAISSRLQLSMVITVLFVVVELLAGIYSNSLALLSDAAHNFTDVLALALSLYALRLSQRPATASRTFGYHRAGILAAFVNAATLIGIALYIFYEAYQRFMAPPQVEEQVMFVIAIVALFVNAFTALILRHAAATDLNVRSAFIHLAGDALSTVGVLVAAVAIQITGWTVLDSAASIIIGVMIAASSWSILREGIDILLESTPRGINVDAMVDDLKQIPGVYGLHDLHIWSISSNLRMLSAHVLTDDIPLSHGANIQREINQILLQRYHINHSALQLEAEGCTDTLYCELGGNGHGA